MAGQMREEAVGGQRGVGLGKFLAVGEQLRTTTEFTDGGLETGQAGALQLRPIDGQIS
jgi:hypothetical protein